MALMERAIYTSCGPTPYYLVLYVKTLSAKHGLRYLLKQSW